MWKTIALGLSATTNMVLIGAGGVVVGMGLLKTYQKATEPKVIAPGSTLVTPSGRVS